MSERKLYTLFLIFFVAISSLFYITPQVEAATCGQACGSSACTDGTICTGGICKATKPTCGAVTPEVTITNHTSGAFTVSVAGVTNADSVNFYVWSDPSGQSDLWPPGGHGIYPATTTGGGVWTATVDLANHTLGPTVYVHAYAFNCSYPQPLQVGSAQCISGSFEIDSSPPTCSIVGPTSVCTGQSATYTNSASDTNLNKSEIWKSPPPAWENIAICINSAAGNCSYSTTFSSTGTYTVVCNAYDSATNKCTGNPSVVAPWANCGASDALTVNVVDPPSCPTNCHTDTKTPSNGTCTTICPPIVTPTTTCPICITANTSYQSDGCATGTCVSNCTTSCSGNTCCSIPSPTPVCSLNSGTVPNGTCGTTSYSSNCTTFCSGDTCCAPYETDVSCTAVNLPRHMGNCTDRTQFPNAPANVTCESLACHVDTQNVADGNCGTHACAPNAPTAIVCSSCGPATSGSDGLCGTKTCDCKDSAPLAPSAVTAAQNNTDINQPARADITWNFGALNGCGEAWGYICGTRANSFSIRVDGVEKATTLPGARSATIAVGSWGLNKKVKVCALNNYTETCSSEANLNLTALDCTVSGHSPTSPPTGCYASFPSLSATYGGGANQIQFAVDNESGFNNPWSCNSDWGSSPYTPTALTCGGIDPTTGTYYWTARSQSTTSPIKCTQSALNPLYSIDIDKTAPSAPATSCSVLGSKITFNWDAVADTGCMGNASVSYLFNLDGADVYGWAANTPYVINPATIGQTYIGQTKSKDGGDNTAGYGALASCKYCPVTAPSNLSPAALTCENTVLRNYTWDSVPGASGYQFQLYVTSQGVGYWCENDSSISAGTTSYNLSSCANNGDLADTKTGVVTWKVLAKYPGTCSNSAFTSESYSVDKTAPSIPNPTILAPVCGDISVTWPNVSDTGCFGNISYRLQAKRNEIVPWLKNTAWGAATSPYIISSAATAVVGSYYKAQVASADNSPSISNQSLWSGDTGQTGETLWTTGVVYCCPTAPTLISPIASSCNGPTFPKDYSWNAVTGATGYNLVIKKVGAGIPCFTVSFGGTSYTLSSDEQTTCSAEGTGDYTWTVQATYDVGCSPSSISTQTFSFDKTAPSVPVATTSLTPDGACLGRYFVNYSWAAVINTPASIYGCSALNSTPYWNQISADNFTNVVDTTFNNTWIDPPAPTPDRTLTSYPPNTVLSTHVRSRDALDNQSLWSGPETITIPIPSPYPTIHIGGSYSEKIGTDCHANMILTSGQLTLNPVVSPDTEVTHNCITTNNRYDCYFTINNTTGSCISPQLSITMNALYEGYGTGGWGGSVCDPLATAAALLVDVENNKNNFNTATIYLDLPLSSGGWFKLKDISFVSRKVNRGNTIPSFLQPFDEDDSTADHSIMIGNSGVLIPNNAIQVGGNAYTGNTLNYSTNNWYTTQYSQTNDISYLKYIDYINARKEFKTIENLSEITQDGVYSISSSVDLTADQFKGKKVVLVVQGIGTNVTFNTNFAPEGGSVAVLSREIVINPAVTNINAILIGQTVSTGIAVTGLKIKGNLIDEEPGLVIGRTQADGRKPSLFVVFDPKIYLDVLPYLSTSTYDWRQIQ